MHQSQSWRDKRQNQSGMVVSFWLPKKSFLQDFQHKLRHEDTVSMILLI